MFLSKIWNINPDLDTKTLDQNTQFNRQLSDNDLSWNCSSTDWIICYKRINSQFFTDTFFATANGKSACGNTCCQIFIIDKGFAAVYPMDIKSQFESALHQFFKDVSVPCILVVGPSGYQKKKYFHCFCHQVGTIFKILEEYTQLDNHVELYVGLFK